MSRTSFGLIVFLRYPESGKVKTRLAKTLGEKEALLIYEELTAITLSVASHFSHTCYLFYEGGVPDDNRKKDNFEYHLQSTGDLGAKILDAIEYVLASHSKAIIIGSDSPALSKEIIDRAADQLDKYDIVIGPSHDGGYYLFGCKELMPSLFENVPWSTSTVMNETISSIQKLGKTFTLLETLTDIDEAEDWISYKKTGR